MDQDQRQERSEQLREDSEKSPAELRAEIEDVRTDLGDTAAALAAKTDVKARAREKADELKRTAGVKKDDLLSKVGRSSTSGNGSSAGGSAGAGAVATQVKTKAEQNPVLVAALGSLIGGFALGRLTRRDD
jgi:chromosome segregation ATPase